MSDIRFNQWLHQSGTGGITQVDGGHVGIGTTNPDIAVHTANTKKVNVGIVTANSVYAGSLYGDGSNISALNASNIASGTVPVARIGTGTKNTSTFYRGDGTFATVTSTTINNNADNRVITGSGTANTLEGESTLTYDGTNLDLGDGKYVRLGAGNDFQMWHNGGTGNTNIKQVTGDMYFYTGSDLSMHIKDGASVDLYYANTKVFETTAYGGKFQKSGEVITLLGSTNGDGVYLSFDGASNGDGAGGDHASISHDSSGNFHIKTDNPSSNASIVFSTNGSTRTVIDESGHLRPISDNTYDLGKTSHRWRNLYTTDLHLSNKGKTNDVDGTWGDWTLQEGEDKIFMINNRTGKKYSLKMEEE